MRRIIERHGVVPSTSGRLVGAEKDQRHRAFSSIVLLVVVVTVVGRSQSASNKARLG